MRAITIPTPGDADALFLAEVPTPDVAEGEVLVQVASAGVNRADLMQRQGFYPAPPGASTYPGMEVSGTVTQVGAGVNDWAVGDQVCALVSGGGYADQVAVPATQLLPVPRGVSLVEAAGLPEVACTVWSNLFLTANLQAGENVLIHGGSGGIGTMAIQLARAMGAHVAVTAGTDGKLDACRTLGAEILINYREQDFVAVLRETTNGHGADVILDNMGAKYLARNVSALAVNGRLVIIGLQGGVKAELDISALLGKCAAVFATSLRGRPLPEKAAITAAVREHVWPLIESGAVRPIVHRTFPLAQAGDAHREMESGANIGKVLLIT